jgi:uncharacterized protein with FMN-binding domain
MKKGIVVILAVAIIGALGIYGKSRPSSAHASPSNSGTSDVQSASSTPAATSSNPASTSSSSASGFKDGAFTGSAIDTPYGTVQIQTIISGGKIVDVKFVTMPNDRGHTQEVTNESAPLLKQETLAKQSANIDFVSGATSTSEGYQQSLQSALNQATMS